MKLSVKIRGSIIVILIISLFFNLFSISNIEAIEEINNDTHEFIHPEDDSEAL